MTRKEACAVLGVSPDAGKREIKRRYRQLMRQVHPDGGAPGEDCAHSAQAVNLAWEILDREISGEGEKESGRKDSHSPDGSSGGRKKSETWNAPVNPNAYTEREVLHYVEDCDGNILGSFCVARGKYLWKTEEDFPLFLLSMYRCGKELLDELDDRFGREEGVQGTFLRREIQPELTYLLSQQFIDGSALLPELAREKGTDREGNRIFYLPAMLELKEQASEPKEGETLFPSGLRKHRLYLKNREGQELGYLSFPDDRMYYIIIPLFEQRRAQIKIRVRPATEQTRKRQGKPGRYRNLHLWIKVSGGEAQGLPESLNLQIERLLQRYAKGVFQG